VPPFPALPDAPQAGSAFGIEVNDRRALDAVWRDNSLWLTTTIIPEAGTDVGETTAHWFKLNTSSVPGGVITLDQHGDIGGEDIAENTYTFFPSVAVNRNNEAAFGFSASAATIYAGAYVTGRQEGDPAGTVQSSETVKAGEAPYKRFFGGTRNRWGDYSGISVDPSNEDFFWVNNEFADEPGNPTVGSQGPEDGRWGTAWARFKFHGKKSTAPIVLGNQVDSPIEETKEPQDFSLSQNNPNPFNPITEISFALPAETEVSLKVFDMLGREVADLAEGRCTAGIHSVSFDAQNLPSGIYLYKLNAGNFVDIKKMVLMK